MVKQCPRCGVRYTKEALDLFESTVKMGFTMNLICGNCGASMVIDESQFSPSGRGSSTPPSAAGKKWWQFWK